MKRFVLVPCPPLRARLQVSTCVAFFESGRKEGCERCPLGQRRGAKGPWESKPGPTELRARNAAFVKWGRKGVKRDESGQFTG